MSIKNPNADQDAVVIENVMKATGLSEAQARELLLMSDDELDGLCDASLREKDEDPPRVK